MAKKSSNTKSFKFKRHHPIGAIQAELDQEFLDNCFIQTGDLDALEDSSNPRSILVGRTGTGKTALFHHIHKTQENVIQVEPENLAIDYIAGSNIIQFFQAAGVNMDMLFRLLWRHVIVVELLQYKFDIRDETGMDRFRRAIREIIGRDRHSQQAIEYLENWGDNFWEHTEYRVREIVSNIETQLSGYISSGVSGVMQGGAEAAKKLDETERKEVVDRGTQAIEQVQIKALKDVIKILDEKILTDPQKKYFVLIDRLDENWASAGVKYQLIRALIEESRTFRTISSLKLVFSMRLDIIERVFREASDSGFQEEKYRDLMMPINWSYEDLRNLAEARISYLLKCKYTTDKVELSDIFPHAVGRRKAFDFIISRTAYRPRDMISYINYVLEASSGKSSITQNVIKSMEEQYSEDRARSLFDEWGSVYPHLEECFEVLYGRQDGFRINTITEYDLDALAIELLNDESSLYDPVKDAAEKYLNTSMSPSQYRFALVGALYHVGVIGLKKDSSGSIRWAFNEGVIWTKPDIKSDSKAYIHPMFYRKLSTHSPAEPSV